MLRVGFGRVDITPSLELGLRLAGHAPYRLATGVTGPLYARVLVADDGESRVAFVCLDLLIMRESEVATLRDSLATAGDLPPESILISCSHTHRAPFTFVTDISPEEHVYGYLDGIYPLLAGAMSAAVEDLRPAQLASGNVVASSWSFNRRPMYTGDEVGTHGSALADDFIGMEDTPDDVLSVLLVRGQDAETLGGLVNFACHPTVMLDEPVYSSDYIGVLVGELETRHGGTFGFILGACGDVSPPNPASDDLMHGFSPEHAAAMGRPLADYADEAISSARSVDSGRISVVSTHVPVAQRRPTREQIDLARWYLEEAPADLDEVEFTQRIYGHQYTFRDGRPVSNESNVRDLLGMWEFQRRAGGREVVEQLEVQVITLGDVAIVGYPAELFNAYGRQVKSESPFADTIVVTLANGSHGYVPTPQAFDHGGYEPRFASSSKLVPEAGGLLTEAALSLLQQQSKQA